MSSFSADGQHLATTRTETGGSTHTQKPQRFDYPGNGETPEMNAGSGHADGGDRRAKSSSPLSQYDEDAKDRDEEEDADMDMDMDMDMEAGDEDVLADQTDRISESTVQPQATPSKSASNPSGLPVEDYDEELLDELDEDDERQSSVTSSTIPLTSLDESPNHRQRLGQSHTTTSHGAVPRTLGVSESSAVPTRADIIETALGESSTLSSIVEAADALSREQEVESQHDDDELSNSDLTDAFSDDTGVDQEDEEEEEGDELEDEEHGREA
jgi:hypothetical protein